LLGEQIAELRGEIVGIKYFLLKGSKTKVPSKARLSYLGWKPLS